MRALRDRWFSESLLLSLLSLIAGSVDAIGFLGLGGIFAGQITGNLVILAVHAVNRGHLPMAHVLSIPVFFVVVGLTTQITARLQSKGMRLLRPLLWVHFLLLACFLLFSVRFVCPMLPESRNAIVAAMMGVSAMSVQNALVRLTLKGAPSTAVMTANATRLTIEVVEIFLRRSPDEVAKARIGTRKRGPLFIAFFVGCALGGAANAAIGFWSLVLPTGLALFACAMPFSCQAR